MDLSFQVMDAQNYFRCMHGVGPLGWDQHLATVAEETARRNANNGRIRHSRRGYGENLAEIEILDIHHASGFGVAKLWYDEIELYDFNRPRFTYKTGHVTQLLWADTIRVGCGVEYNHGAIFVACEYSPPGNVYGQYERNVYPPLYRRP
ncbi:uncharacterized protein [Ptychodera flava]|uniref:uncharacterized protein n=1 Tax=Ptychodera flava TaxID=63121 RepID=UPI003969EDB2